MDRKLPVASLLSLTITALLAGCGGGGNDSEDTPTPATKSLEVRAVDGYLKDALVWLDTNGDYALTAGEPNTTTDGTGKAILNVTAVDNPAKYRVLVQAIAKKTTDVGDGTGGTSKLVTKTFTMAAPAGVSTSSVTVTPLTTLVAQQMATNTGMTQAQAAQEVATQLGLGADKAGELLKDFIADKNSTSQIYALNIVAALPEELDDDTADDLLTQGAAIGKALDDYLAQNPLDNDTQPDDIKVVLNVDGSVDDVIKDSDGDGQDDDDIPPVTSDTLASFLSKASNWYIGGGDEGDADFRIEEWKSLGSGKASWSAKYQLRGTTAYAQEPNESETMYDLTENGWVQTSERTDIQYVANSDGSVSLTDISHLGTMTGSCSDLSGKSQASEVAWEAKSAQVVNASATFSSGAYGCRASYTSGGYYSDNEAEELHGDNHASSNVATSFSDLFVTTAPVAGDAASFTTWLWWDAPQTYYRLVLIGDPAQSDAGKAQLWSNDGVTLLKEVTSAGWKKVVVYGQSLILLDSAISSYASDLDDGLALLQGKVVRVKSDQGESMLLLNQTAYDDLMKGRTLVTDSDDGDGDGQDDDDIPPVTSDTLASFLLSTSDMYMAGDGGADELWTDHWQSLGSGKFSWQESNILIGKSQYMVDPYTDDKSYRLTDAGWTAMTEYKYMQFVGNSDGSVSFTDKGQAAKLTGSCKDVGGKTLASAVSAITESTQVVDGSATFTAGALGCEVRYTAMATDAIYRIENWTHAENSVYVNGVKASTLADLFSSSAPVADGLNAIATVFDKPIDTWSESYGNVRLVLVRSAANATSGIAQLWQYNANVHGYQLLSDVTPANHQGWTLQTLHGVTLLTLSDTIQQYLNQGDDYMRVGLTEWQGRVQWVDNDNGGGHDETILFMNKVAYDDLMKGRTLVTDSDDSDGDGVADTNDAFPNDASEWSDTDGDDVGNNGDAFPNDPTKWDDVIKDSDGDGQDDDDIPPVPSDTLASFLLSTSDMYMVGDGYRDGEDLWTDHWQSLGSGEFGWKETYVLLGKTQYKVDSSTGDVRYRLTDAGWTEMTHYEDMQLDGNSDGSVSLSDIGGVGKLTGSCQDVGGKTLASIVTPLTGSTQVVDSSATFSPGALGCEVIYTPMATDFNYQVETWEYVGANAVQVNGQQATALADLFSSSAPVASGPNAVATVFDKPIAAYSEQYGEVWLVLVRSAANATSGVAQLWQYNSTLHGYQLLSDITPANHQGWKLQTLHGVTLLTFSDAIQRYLEDEGHKAGFTEWQGRVQWVANSDDANAETILFMNKVAYDDLMKGRTLVTDSDDDDGDGETTPAAAFVSLINSDEIVYSVYQEHGALGLTRVDGNSYQGYQLDYGQTEKSFVPTDAGTFTLSVDANNQVTMFDAVSGTTSTIICQQVQALAGVKIQDLLAPMTSEESLAAMQQTFGDATFTGDAKAYINQHTDSEGSSLEIVLNETAYQNLVASIRNPS